MSNLDDMIQKYNQELLSYHQRNRVRVPLTPQEESVPAEQPKAVLDPEDEVVFVSAPADEGEAVPTVGEADTTEPVAENQPNTTAELNAEPDAAAENNAPMDIVSPQLVPETRETLPQGATGMLPGEEEPPATDTGYLVIQTFTARQALPVAGAHVTVSRQNGDGEDLYKIAVTDMNGRTQVMALPAASRELSQQPGVNNPFTTYIIRVNAAGFVPVRDFRVPVYGGVTAIQPTELIPLPETASDQPEDVGPITIVESGPQEL